VESRALEEVAGRAERTRVSFSALMPWRVRSILLVSSLYDSFTFQEDGDLTEMLFSEYLELNLSYAPAIERVSTAEDALARVADDPPDLLITMPRVGETDVLDFGREVKRRAPELPVVILGYDTRELALLRARESAECVDRIFVWQGDARLFLAIIKLIEDRINAEHDAAIAGVKSIILVEDSVRFYSAYLPLLYTEIMEQTQALMTEGVNRMQQLMRMRARPKIMMATTYEEGLALYERYREHLLGVIVDARFPRGGRSDPGAGERFVQRVKDDDPDVPVLMQSTDAANRTVAARLHAAFIHKNSPTLLRAVRRFLRAYLGFGDFIFRRPDGTIVGRAHDLRELTECIRSMSDEALFLHAARNDFSTWLMARTEFDLAKALRPRRAEEFETPQALRQFLLAELQQYRSATQAGLVSEFSGTFDATSHFVKIGKGSLGGKGRGLAFVNSLLQSYQISDRFDGVKIHVPPTAVVATDVFDRFIEAAELAPLALGDQPDEEIRRAFLAAELPETTVAALRAFLAGVDYPLAVRSSSLLEDSSYQPFAGIYQTYMLPNNDPDPERRLADLCRAIRLVYASTYYADSKSYIASTPNRLEEEKMAVVIQQMVGTRHGDCLYPDAAGVTRSYDYYPVHDMRPEEGVASVALGLGRTVVDGGRCVRFSPAHPRRLYQFSSSKAYLETSQREFYALDLAQPAPVVTPEQAADANLVQLDIEAAAQHGTLAAVGSVYSPENDIVYEGVHRPGIKLITMAGFLSGTAFPLPEVLSFLMDVGKAGFSCHVEMEFAVKLARETGEPHEFAFLQIRPLVLGPVGEEIDLGDVDPRAAICISDRALGHGFIEGIRDVVYVSPRTFDRAQTRTIAAEIGSFNAALQHEARPYLLVGPGRWGSADPWLGIPVHWTQIAGVRCIIEAQMQDIAVEPSQGTHFFQNITSFGLGYFTLQDGDGGGHLETAWLESQAPLAASEHVRHLRFDRDLAIAVDGRSGRGVIMKPGHALPAP